MPLIGRVGRKRLRSRLAIGVLYGLLSLGALTTLYPFLLMVSIGLKGPTDQNDLTLVPQYLSDQSGKKEDGTALPTSLLGKYLADKYAGNADEISATRLGVAAPSDQVERYQKFLLSLPEDRWRACFRAAANQVTSRLNGRYQDWLRARFGTIERLNTAYTEENTAFETVAPPLEFPERKDWKPTRDRKYLDWLEFKSSLPAEFREPITTQRLFQLYLRQKTKNQLAQVPPAVVGVAKTFEQITVPVSGPELAEFKSSFLPQAFETSAEDLWHSAGGTGDLPIQPYEEQYLASHAAEIKQEFATRNYRYVLSYILLNGRVLWNTLLFGFLAILAQLTINPIAAYALSRYPIRASGKILMFLLATMAFPAEVSMIPSFLLLKQLGLLNTFAALVLPAAASGYMIFLLKGFFDSLPPELYESGQIDGARELTMFRRIALPLSRPVLGYLSLLAFMGAYGSFLFAFLIAQDRKIWTLMVWIYQLQGLAPKAVMMAALTLAAAPTLMVFMLCQRVIMRGIILPGEK
ncbi:MAG: ABC transporter permease subunit [Armatimonadetes bacterium]|nr:ABC transporter permease subunit [Armatimonadota bacterium]